MEIHKMMVMSTGHISKETATLLDLDKAGIVVYKKGEYGWFLVVTDWQDAEEPIPIDLEKCLAYAELHGCAWLCLDCDGPMLPDLPQYTW